jgi:hypothetical protein
MTPAADNTNTALPTPGQLRQAIELYLAVAYPGGPPPSAARLWPSGDDAAAWLMSEATERTPPDAPLEVVRSFSVRLGNWQYPHMKLRISRPPRDDVFIFTVDSHDAFLQAPAGTPDFDALEELKRHNNELASRIAQAWDKANLPTEKNYLRLKIRQVRDGRPPA